MFAVKKRMKTHLEIVMILGLEMDQPSKMSLILLAMKMNGSEHT